MSRRRAQRTYRLVVRLYPAAHRRAFGDEMVQAFGDHYRDAVECRGGSRLRFWLAVLADAGGSLRTEYAAVARSWRPHRRVGASARSRRDRGRPRAARRLRYHRRRYRVLIRTRRHGLIYRGRVGALIAFAVVAGVAFGTATAIGHLGIGALLAGLTVAGWLAYGLRLARRAPAGPQGNGPTPPGGASVREPRRPLPICPAGSATRPTPDPDEPGQAVALI